jgi:hypothetical protein
MAPAFPFSVGSVNALILTANEDRRDTKKLCTTNESGQLGSIVTDDLVTHLITRLASALTVLLCWQIG